MRALLRYLPVPTKRRERKGWPPIVSGSSTAGRVVVVMPESIPGGGVRQRPASCSASVLPAAHEVHQLDHVPVGEAGLRHLVSPDDPAVELHHHRPLGEAELPQEVRHGGRRREPPQLAVDGEGKLGAARAAAACGGAHASASRSSHGARRALAGPPVTGGASAARPAPPPPVGALTRPPPGRAMAPAGPSRPRPDRPHPTGPRSPPRPTPRRGTPRARAPVSRRRSPPRDIRVRRARGATRCPARAGPDARATGTRSPPPGSPRPPRSPPPPRRASAPIRRSPGAGHR